MKRFKYFLESFGWFLFFLIVIEIVIRLLIKSPTGHFVNDPVLGRVIEKGNFILWAEEGFGTTYYQDNGEVATPYSGGENILVFGDSNTVAWQVWQGQKFTSVTEQALREKGINVDIRNLGIPSATLAEYVYIAEGAIEKYNPKLVVIELTYFQARGAFNPNRNNYFEIKKDGAIEFIRQGGNKNITQLKRVRIRPLAFCDYATISSIVQMMCQRTSSLFVDVESSVGVPDAWEDKLPELALELQGAYQDIPLIIVILPNVPVIKNNSIKLDDASGIVYQGFSEIPDLHIVYPLSEFIATTEQGEMPRGFSNSVPGTGHLNSVGHEIVGNLLAATIEDILR